jgi:hypothetical protein
MTSSLPKLRPQFDDAHRPAVGGQPGKHDDRESTFVEVDHLPVRHASRRRGVDGLRAALLRIAIGTTNESVRRHITLSGNG